MTFSTFLSFFTIKNITDPSVNSDITAVTLILQSDQIDIKLVYWESRLGKKQVLLWLACSHCGEESSIYEPPS